MSDISSNGGSGGGPSGRIGIGLDLDATHLKILEVLRENGRISVSALADRVGISRANAYTRFEALRADGAIKRFTAEIDHVRTGLGITALIFVTVRQQMWRQFRAELARMPEVEYCAITTGQHDAMIQVRMADVAEVHAMVTDRLANIPAVKATETVFILDEVLRRPYVLPSDREKTRAPRRTVQEERGDVPLGKMRFVGAAEGRAALRKDD
ncbi:Lrp/AsnC family transcriptional regulator [Nonomuraea muscovyensis]|uniref:DNA-binding Lrp family transcriptional regulator n=1 Tax=Nonomuraea muscovyensis TaxID=1124761 RepID=A0A7X0C1Z6_9ACTN|nr:Lrp/AsnC family transcriptional regulator [Nonomuraea muscovyensis]MBB6346963.1 DNA-binding Lrp family transcriptional regulator [Nonomuraea muscovyensis]MDF2707582.1 AsnC family transcriptional regulator [Nonomuraea muscovyensis]